MKKLETFIFAITLAVGISAGASIENARITKYESANSAVPVAAVAITSCSKLVGFIVVSKDGSLHPVPPGTTITELEKLIAGFPDSHKIMATLPCAGFQS